MLICGLIINNRIYYSKYNKVNTNTEILTDNELKDIASVYQYITDFGNDIYNGFDTQTELIIYNREYEFLFTDDEYGDEWKFIGHDEITEKNIYRRKADTPQAFAIKLYNHWVASFCTHDYYNVSILEQVPVFMPPQMFLLDDIAYKSIIVHEMVHALQGNRDSYRVDAAEHIHNVCSAYYGNNDFNNLIKQEGKILKEAINLTDIAEITSKVHEFIAIRDSRRNTCGMTYDEISSEKEIEWLEGMARYAEYIASKGSKSIIAKNLDDITQKVVVSSDDRYYALGMAEIMLIKKLNITDWQQKLFHEKYTPEDILTQIFSTVQ